MTQASPIATPRSTPLVARGSIKTENAAASDVTAATAATIKTTENAATSDELLNRHRRLLLHRISRRYQTRTERITIDPLCFDFTRIADPDRVLDEVAAAADLQDRLSGGRADAQTLHLPYWAELWDSARGIAQHLLGPDNRLIFPGDRVLDLGCGMGMSGTVAAAMGARVTFADLEPPALLFARLNSLPWRSRIQTRQLNWQTDAIDRQFTLVIGADILYERAQWPYLEPFWRRHLAPGGAVLLGEPGRQTGDLFIEWITPRGWRLMTTLMPVTTRPKPIRIFQLQIE